MRILAIRGCNLASLAGRFAIELDEGALGQAGLFAVTGPTGAGKSTLLDALCVSLFDKTPRLHTRSAVSIGRADDDDAMRVSATDVRSLLRHGTGSGYAEVEFSGRDEHRYRARWSVRRARGRADGRLQSQTMELEDLTTGRDLSGTKSETLTAIEDRLGFSFEQFRRSALLAQGDFAAFLRANANERAALLERMTGTGIYGELSVAAYRRCADETRELSTLLKLSDAHSVLSDESRVALQAEHVAARSRLDNATRSLRGAEAARDWHVRLASLRTGETAALTQRDALQAAWDEATEWRDELEAVLAVQSRRGVLRACDDAELARVAAIRSHADSVCAAATASEQHAEAEVDAMEAEAVVLAERTRHVRDVEARGVAAQTWLADRDGVEAIAAEWPRWQSALDRFSDAARSIGELDREREALLAADEAGRQALAAATEARLAARSRLEQVRAIAEAAECAAAEQPLDVARRRRDELAGRRDHLRELASCAELATEAAGLAGEARRAAAASRTEAETLVADGRRLSQRAKRVEVTLAEAERTLDQMRLALSLVDQRASLVPGEACPCCGSTEHPYADGASPIDMLSAEQHQRVDDLRQERDELERQRADVRARGVAATAASAQAEARGADSDRVVADATRRWQTALETIGELPLHPDPSVPEAATWISSLCAAVEARYAESASREQAAAVLSDAAAAARGNIEARRSECDHADASFRDAETAERVARQALAECDASRARAAEARSAQVGELALGFERVPGWRADLAADPARFRDRWSTEVDSWVVRHDELDATRRQLAELRPVLEAAIARADERVLERAGSAATATDASGSASVEAAEAGLDRARGRLGRAAAADAAAAAKCVAMAEAVADARGRRHRAASELADALAEAGVDEQTLRRRLAHDDDWIAAGRVRLDAMRSELARACAVGIERREQRMRHEASGPPELAESSIDAAIESASQDVAAATESYTEVAGRLRVDDEARKRRAEVSERVAEQRDRAAVYKALSELIGSADGKKFRTFAQSLTLDALLGFANDHLAELASRYRLVRVPGYDLDLQVIDRGMGDEVRSVNSLSGGESFLVSLALALGLSSLSARDTRVESLLIDEGFGTLDPSTLEVALSVLDALQASGRKVGLISHVPGLAERIGVRVTVSPRGGGRSVVSVSDR